MESRYLMVIALLLMVIKVDCVKFNFPAFHSSERYPGMTMMNDCFISSEAISLTKNSSGPSVGRVMYKYAVPIWRKEDGIVKLGSWSSSFHYRSSTDGMAFLLSNHSILLKKGDMQAWVDYDGDSKTLSVGTLGGPYISYRIDLPKYIYVGFSATSPSTSNNVQIHELHSWQFTTIPANPNPNFTLLIANNTRNARRLLSDPASSPSSPTSNDSGNNNTNVVETNTSVVNNVTVVAGNDPPKHKKLSGGEIAGIAAGAYVGVGIVIGCVIGCIAIAKAH